MCLLALQNVVHTTFGLQIRVEASRAGLPYSRTTDVQRT